MHFNSFPDDCILHIFSHLPLQNLLRIEIVCRKWQSVQRVACRQRHTVLLLVGNGALDNALNSIAFAIPFDDILVKEDGTPMFVSFADKANWHGLHCTEDLSEPICRWLVDKLPNITSLQMSIAFQAYTMIYSTSLTTHPSPVNVNMTVVTAFLAVTA